MVASDLTGIGKSYHGSAPDMAVKNVANPMGIMLSTVMFLDWLAGRHPDVVCC